MNNINLLSAIDNMHSILSYFIFLQYNNVIYTILIRSLKNVNGSIYFHRMIIDSDIHASPTSILTVAHLSYQILLVLTQILWQNNIICNDEVAESTVSTTISLSSQTNLCVILSLRFYL